MGWVGRARAMLAASRSSQICWRVVESTHMPSQEGHSKRLRLPIWTEFMADLHLGQGSGVPSAEWSGWATAPQWGQNFEPTNIMPKHCGHATVASAAAQNLHLAESEEMAAPQLGQWRVSAVGMRGG